MKESTDTEKIKAFLEIVNSSDKYITKPIYDGQKTFAFDVTKGTLFIIDTFEGNYAMDFVTPDGIKAISVILEEAKMMEQT